MKISVVVSTYNAEKWLEKVLIGYSVQTYKDFEVIIADDGSRPSTKELIDKYAADYPVPLRHLWHEDQGYRRQEILNIAIMEAANEFIIMTESGVAHSLHKRAPHKKFHFVPNENCNCSECPYMKRNTLEKLRDSLRTLSPRVELPVDLMNRARLPIERMLAVK